MANLITGIRNRIRARQAKREYGEGPVTFVLDEYHKRDGVFLGADEDPYRLKVTPDGMEILPKDGGELAQADPEVEKAKIQKWIQDYGIQATLVQRYLRVSLGLAPNLPEGQGGQKEQKP